MSISQLYKSGGNLNAERARTRKGSLHFYRSHLAGLPGSLHQELPHRYLYLVLSKIKCIPVKKDRDGMCGCEKEEV